MNFLPSLRFSNGGISAMRAGIRISTLVPSGLVIEGVSDSSDSIILAVRSEGGVAECPLCGARSRRIHSRYDRQVADLPCAGKEIRLRVITRRFVCKVPHCRRRIFAERFGDDVLPTRSRRTTRLECIVHHLDLALGGRPAASFVRRLMLPVSNDTLLRVVRRRTCPPTEPLIVAGIDDWAFRKNHRYGTIVCDLERRRIVALLPDREIATVRAWLSAHPEIRVVSRDRGGGYGEAAAKALPDALQVADPLASDGECERGLPRGGAPVHALDPCRDRHDHDQSGAAHLCGKAAISGLSASPGDQCRDHGARQRRGPNQGDRPQNRAQPSTRSPCQPRPKHGYLSYPAEHTRRSLTVPGRAMGRGMSERDRALAPSAGAGLPGFLTCRQRMEDKAATSGEGD